MYGEHKRENLRSADSCSTVLSVSHASCSWSPGYRNSCIHSSFRIENADIRKQLLFHERTPKRTRLERLVGMDARELCTIHNERTPRG